MTGGRFLARMSEHLKGLGIETYAPDFKPNTGAADLRDLAADLKGHVESARSENAPLYLVGFSMGGLVCRYYMQRLQGAERIERWATISTPHHGTLTAYGFWGKGVSQMRINSAFLNDLNKDINLLQEVPFLSLWTPFDLMILPADSSVLPIGINQEVHIAAHPFMHSSRMVTEKIGRFLQGES